MLRMYLSTWTHAHIYSWNFGPGLVLLANIYHNDIPHNGIQHYGIQHNGIHHNGFSELPSTS